MKQFIPDLPYSVFAELLNPQEKTEKGSVKKSYIKIDDIYISFRTFGGTETVKNDILVVENTATVQTWYRPDIKAGSRLKIGGLEYDILGTPENINMANKYLQFKVRAVKGGA
nr:MAG TPA: head tail joining protein [Caudoviricetes sp.]